MYGYWLWWIVLDQCDKYGFFMFINLMHLKNCWIKSEFLVGFKIKKYIMEFVFIKCNNRFYLNKKRLLLKVNEELKKMWIDL